MYKITETKRIGGIYQHCSRTSLAILPVLVSLSANKSVIRKGRALWMSHDSFIMLCSTHGDTDESKTQNFFIKNTTKIQDDV